jgi:hypothetical protein
MIYRLGVMCTANELSAYQFQVLEQRLREQDASRVTYDLRTIGTDLREDVARMEPCLMLTYKHVQFPSRTVGKSVGILANQITKSLDELLVFPSVGHTAAKPDLPWMLHKVLVGSGWTHSRLYPAWRC